MCGGMADVYMYTQHHHHRNHHHYDRRLWSRRSIINSSVNLCNRKWESRMLNLFWFRRWWKCMLIHWNASQYVHIYKCREQVRDDDRKEWKKETETENGKNQQKQRNFWMCDANRMMRMTERKKRFWWDLNEFFFLGWERERANVCAWSC